MRLKRIAVSYEYFILLSLIESSRVLKFFINAAGFLFPRFGSTSAFSFFPNLCSGWVREFSLVFYSNLFRLRLGLTSFQG